MLEQVQGRTMKLGKGRILMDIPMLIHLMTKGKQEVFASHDSSSPSEACNLGCDKTPQRNSYFCPVSLKGV